MSDPYFGSLRVALHNPKRAMDEAQTVATEGVRVGVVGWRRAADACLARLEREGWADAEGAADAPFRWPSGSVRNAYVVADGLVRGALRGRLADAGSEDREATIRRLWDRGDLSRLSALRRCPKVNELIAVENAVAAFEQADLVLAFCAADWARSLLRGKAS